MISTLGVRGPRRPAAPVALSGVGLFVACGGIVLALAWLAPQFLMPTLAVIGGASVLWLVWAGVPMLSALLPRLRWWHVLWTALFLSDFTFRIRSAEASVENPLDPWAVYRVALVGIVAVTLLLRLSMKATNPLAVLSKGAVGWLMVYGLVNLASVAWSVYPAWTAYKSLEFLTDLALLAAIVATLRSLRGYKTIFDWTWALYGGLLLVVWAGVFVWPSVALEPTRGLLGISISGVVPLIPPNTVGRMGAVLGIVAMIRLARPTAHRGFYAVAFLLSLASLIFAQSRGPLAGFLLALVVILIAMRRWRVSMAIAAAALIVLLTPGLRDAAQQFVLRGQDAELFQSLSGRTTWWNYAWDRFQEHPLVGFGGFAGPRFTVLANIGESETSTLHNTWLEVLLSTGALGLALLLAALVSVCTALWRFRALALHEAETGGLWLEAVGVLIVLLVTSTFSTELIWHPALFFLAIVGYAQQLRG
ncbi:MAG TPA: O-antigen ligase family protein [bacterium]|nr:O-antigen ligase family protein [bacterium]